MGLFSKKAPPVSEAGPASEAVLPDRTKIAVKQQVNCLGDSCPRPQLLTRKALASAAQGDVIEVLIDNPTSVEAIPPMMPGLARTHLATVRAERCWRVYVRKG